MASTNPKRFVSCLQVLRHLRLIFSMFFKNFPKFCNIFSFFEIRLENLEFYFKFNICLDSHLKIGSWKWNNLKNWSLFSQKFLNKYVYIIPKICSFICSIFVYFWRIFFINVSLHCQETNLSNTRQMALGPIYRIGYTKLRQQPYSFWVPSPTFVGLPQYLIHPLAHFP